MHYGRFLTQITLRYRLRIAGWPASVPFAEPSSLPMPLARHLLQCWEQGQIQYVTVSAEELEVLDAAARLQVQKVRKQRSDIGVQRVGVLTPEEVDEAMYEASD